MGVKATLPNYKSFTFGGKNSRAYGVYITGEGVFNAPERNVEMIEIPGRNGAFALDKGNFNNIEVTYPAGLFADTESDFADAVSDFRNFLCSQNGYVRLEDDYNTGEYRLAIYKSGLEVSHDMLTNGEFDIVFECKPQRFLTSGETAVAVASGGTLTNPTLFDAKPLLEVEGFGTINIGDGEITIHNEPIGDIVVVNSTSYNKAVTATITFNDQFANIGDAIECKEFDVMGGWAIDSGTFTGEWDDFPVTGYDYSFNTSVWFENGNKWLKFQLWKSNIVFTYGTASTLKYGWELIPETTAYSWIDDGFQLFTIAYDGANTITFTSDITMLDHCSMPNPNPTLLGNGEIVLHSTQTNLGNPLYVDLDIGEAYKMENGSTISVNNGVILPANLPTLKAGANEITYDNTYTDVKVVPRWWKV